MSPKRDPIRYVSKELNDTRSFEVQNYNDIFVCMGLCDGHAASVLGLLHEGDCFAVSRVQNKIELKLLFKLTTRFIVNCCSFNVRGRRGLDRIVNAMYN